MVLSIFITDSSDRLTDTHFTIHPYADYMDKLQ